MVLSTRVSIQWGSDGPAESTHTLVSTSAADHFVDVRILTDRYPHIQTTEEPESFESIFDWAIVGEEKPIENTSKILFDHLINLQDIFKSLKLGKPFKSEPDIGDFSAIEGSEDRKETGEMVNPATNQLTPYVEIWRSLNPSRTTPTQEVREDRDEEGNEVNDENVINATYEFEHDSMYGRCIILGKWIQGVIHDRSDKTHPLSIYRAFHDDKEDKWVPLIRYGKQFASDFSPEILTIDSRWSRIE
ncbi:hypothetical protein PUMCH_004121 [Australozyma saopauloensis]|uniref:Protein HRI1 n=1 Tax=Australozyma saopauloensis TaxID=291208 RepID=A0AAX4HGJ7_9ASCO|nr:hypothetical protein PUMCH_004121 [[Candida] saopauloensis]